MSVDFTRTSGGSNLLNQVNSSFSTTVGNANLVLSELNESYAVFSQSDAIYGGNQNQEYAGTSTGTVDISRNDSLSDRSVSI
jgi:hypothetical protein